MRTQRYIGAVAAAALLLTFTPAGEASTNSDRVLARLVSANSGLRSFTANVNADVVMRSFPYLSADLGGTYYHKEPSKDRVVFTSGLPLIAKQFSNVYPHVESPARWHDVYDISVERDDGTYTTFKLAPRSPGRIDHIDAKVGDKSGELAQLRWNYTDGSYATLNQTYGKVGAYRLVTRETGHFENPNYNADLSSTFTNFKVNVAIPDSTFSN
ncbi:MAG TPA: hypothetical protein VFW34_09080 [Candidatus Rubrimentiphilum sp.]|nr:hypothetical protein [Candidatus Rubrimentiphilum sp.]